MGETVEGWYHPVELPDSGWTSFRAGRYIYTKFRYTYTIVMKNRTSTFLLLFGIILFSSSLLAKDS